MNGVFRHGTGWAARITAKGRREIIALGPDEARAEDLAARVRHKLGQGERLDRVQAWLARQISQPFKPVRAEMATIADLERARREGGYARQALRRLLATVGRGQPASSRSGHKFTQQSCAVLTPTLVRRYRRIMRGVRPGHRIAADLARIRQLFSPRALAEYARAGLRLPELAPFVAELRGHCIRMPGAPADERVRAAHAAVATLRGESLSAAAAAALALHAGLLSRDIAGWQGDVPRPLPSWVTPLLPVNRDDVRRAERWLQAHGGFGLGELRRAFIRFALTRFPAPSVLPLLGFKAVFHQPGLATWPILPADLATLWET